MGRKKVKPTDTVEVVEWFIDYLFYNIENYLLAFPDRDMQNLNYRIWGGIRWAIKLEREDAIIDSQERYFHLQKEVGLKLAMENSEGVLTVEYKNSRPSEWSCLCYRPDCSTAGLIGRPREMLKHLKVVHAEDHEFACLICDIPFANVNSLMGHQGATHKWTPWCSDRHFSTRVRRVGGPKPVSGKTKHARSVEKLGSNLVASRMFQNGETGCFCTKMDDLYPWGEMVKSQMAMPLVQKSVSEVVTKRKPSLCGEDPRMAKKRKLGN